MKIIWVGRNPKGKSQGRLKEELKRFGFTLQDKWDSLSAFSEKARPHIFLCAGSGQMTSRLMGIAKKSGIPVFFPNGTTPGAAIRCLKDNGLITNANRPAALYGFHDEEKAKEVNPVTKPLISDEEAEKMRSRMFDSDKKVPVWLVDNKATIISNGRAARPVVLDGKFYETAALAADHLKTSRGDVNSVLAKGKGTIRGLAIRRAYLREVFENVEGSYRDTSKDKTTPKKKFNYKVRDGSPYVMSENGRPCRPVFIEGEVFKSIHNAAEFMETHGATISNVCNGKQEIPGYEIHYATESELKESFPEAELIADTPIAKKKKPEKVFVPASGDSRLKRKIHSLLSSDKPDEVKLAAIDVLLDYSEDAGRLTNKLRDIVNGKHALIKIETLLDYDRDSGEEG